MSDDHAAAQPAPVPIPVDTRAFRRSVGTFATGVTVITTATGDVIHGMTANSFTSVSLDPLLILVCVDRRARLCALLQQPERAFGVSVLSDRQEDLSRHFAGSRGNPPPASLAFDRDTPDGPPLIRGALATLSCVVTALLDGGDHVIVLGRVTDFRAADPPGEPLLYFGGRYRRLREPDEAGPADRWQNDAVQIYYDGWGDPGDAEWRHPIA